MTDDRRLEAQHRIEIPLVLLAAGNGSRAGRPKGLIEYNGRPWILEQVERFRAVGGRDVIVVLGHGRDEYLKALKQLTSDHGPESEVRSPETRNQGKFQGVRVVTNPFPERGQFSSLVCGLRTLPEEASAAFLLPVDVPAAGPEVWEALAPALRAGVVACMPVWQGHGGHPVLLSRQFIMRLLGVDLGSPNARLDRQLHLLHPNELARVSVGDASVCMNLNTPADWRQVC